MNIYIKKKQRGIAAVEFILVLPVLLILMVALSEIGSILVRYNTLNKLVQNGSRYAVTNIYGTATTDQIAPIDKIKNVVLYGDDNGGGIVAIDTLTADSITVTHNDNFVTVTISYDYIPFIDEIPIFGIPLTITISASSMMRTG
ncbi:TadE/TadG family type IV pilus assembly protein [Aliivibrio fischeri]|uniref:TadE/TadG family type IV pilus assembly protein n=1 Tax=Aliivibrio fischeri TaxID=668 RepID=UPI003736E23F